MRLRRLDLTRFGHFTDFTLDFGEKPVDQPDFHIVYGPNEAGKSTAFEGYLNLVFGIPTKTPLAFKHARKNMQIGGCLEIGGVAHELIRTGQRSPNDLKDPQGNVISQLILKNALAGMSPEQYRAMFSLDDSSLKAGGNDLLSAKGDLGKLLFSAASGLSDIGDVLDETQAQASEFMQGNRVGVRLKQLKSGLAQLDAEIEQADTNVTRFKQLRATCAQAEQALETAREQRALLQKNRGQLAALAEAIPLWQEVRQQQQAAREYGEGVRFEPDWLLQARDLRDRQLAAETRLKTAQESRAALQAEQKGLRHDPEMLARAGGFSHLRQELKSRWETACKDLPKRQASLAEIENDIQTALAGTGLSSGQLADVGLSQLEKLDRHARHLQDCAREMRQSRAEYAAAQQEQELLEAGDSLGDPQELEALNAALAQTAPDGLISDWKAVCRDGEKAAQAVRATLAALAPWQGDAELPAPPIGAPEARRRAKQLQTLEDQASRTGHDLQRLRLSQAKKQALVQELIRQDGLLNEQEVAAARVQRDRLWQEHIAALTPQTAADFEQAMAGFDRIQNSRLQMAERVAQMRGLQLELVETEQEITGQEQELAAVKAQIIQQNDQFKALFKTLSLPEGFAPDDLPEWLENLGKAQAAQEELRAAQAARTELAANIACAQEILQGLLPDADKTGDLAALTSRARSRLNRLSALAEQYKTLQGARKKTAMRRDRNRRDQQQFEQAQTDWAGATGNTPFQGLEPDDFARILPGLRAALAALERKKLVQRQVDGMTADMAAYGAKIGELAENLGMETGAVDFLDQALSERLQAAQDTEKQAVQLSRQIKAHQLQESQAGSDIKKISQDIEMLSEKIGFTGRSAKLIPALENAEKATRLQAEIARNTQRLQALLGEEWQSAVAQADLAQVQADLAAVEQELQGVEEQVETALGDHRSARDALAAAGGDDVVARLLVQRQNKLLEIEEAALASLRGHLGVMVAQKALERYRDAHRSGMLAHTEQAFVGLTAGNYRALRTQADGRNEVLLAVQAADDQTKRVTDLSKGTEFQLYLALRLAGYKQFLADGIALPFIADDIMESFDSERTQAALELMSQMGQGGQAIYLTHHEHVVEMARRKFGRACHVIEIGPVNPSGLGKWA